MRQSVAAKGQIALDRAEKEFPDNSFVQSCRIFFDDRGYLTDKQICALELIEDREWEECDPYYHFNERQ